MPQFGSWDSDERWEPRERREPAPVPYGAMETYTNPYEDYGTWSPPAWSGSASPSYNFGEVPEFDAPDFYAPTFADAQNEPGYQFRLGAGQKALESSAAARGLLRTGGTLKDILEYGQNFGAQEYQNVYDRALRSYGARYQAAKDEYAPYLAQYQNRFGAEQARAMAEFQRQFDLYGINNDNAWREEMLRFQLLNQPPPAFPLGGM